MTTLIDLCKFDLFRF